MAELGFEAGILPVEFLTHHVLLPLVVTIETARMATLNSTESEQFAVHSPAPAPSTILSAEESAKELKKSGVFSCTLRFPYFWNRYRPEAGESVLYLFI